MAHGGSDSSDVITFHGIDLLHKFGFGDGDVLYEVIEEHDLGVDHHDLLVAVVDRLVVPRFDQEVVTSTWPRPTLHNPIRAVTVDGEEASMQTDITPDAVEIPVAEIIRIARSLSPAEEDADDTPSSPSAVTGPLPVSFGADQLIAGARHVRRTHGGAALHLHHWLAAVLQDDARGDRVLGDVDREALATAVDRRLAEGDLDFPFPADEARDRATARARRADHDVVTTDDLAEAVVVAAAGLLRRLDPPSRPAADADATPADTDRPPARPSPSPRRRTSWRPDWSKWRHSTGLKLIIGGIVVVAIALPIGWVLYRQRIVGVEDALGDRVGDFTEALATGDGDSACAMLSEEAAEDLVDRVRRELGETGRRLCPAAVQVAASERTPAQDETLTDLEVEDVDHDAEWMRGAVDEPSDFERATATVVVAGDEVALLTEDIDMERAGSWIITDPGPILDLLVPE